MNNYLSAPWNVQNCRSKRT